MKTEPAFIVCLATTVMAGAFTVFGAIAASNYFRKENESAKKHMWRVFGAAILMVASFFIRGVSEPSICGTLCASGEFYPLLAKVLFAASLMMYSSFIRCLFGGNNMYLLYAFTLITFGEEDGSWMDFALLVLLSLSDLIVMMQSSKTLVNPAISFPFLLCIWTYSIANFAAHEHVKLFSVQVAMWIHVPLPYLMVFPAMFTLVFHPVKFAEEDEKEDIQTKKIE